MSNENTASKGVGSTGGSALNLGNAEWISMVKRKPTTGNLPFLVYAPKRQPKARLALMVERCPVSPDWEYWAEVSLPNTELRNAHNENGKTL